VFGLDGCLAVHDELGLCDESGVRRDASRDDAGQVVGLFRAFDAGLAGRAVAAFSAFVRPRLLLLIVRGLTVGVACVVLVASSCAGDKPHPLEEVEGCRLLAATGLWECDAGTNLRGLDLSDVDLSGASLRQVDMTAADLSGANLTDADLNNADLYDADLRGTDLTGVVFQVVAMSGANLSGNDLSNAYMRGAILDDANLSGSNLSNANLTDADLSGADLTGADLTRADLRNADLRGADICDAYFSETNAIGALINEDQVACPNLEFEFEPL